MIQTRALYQCSHCRHQCSLISDTIFASTKLPLTTLFLAIYFITQSKDGISSLNLARTLGITANAAQRVKHKLQQVMKHADDSRPLPGIVQLDDTYWDGRKHGGKRGRGASGKTPFLAAVSTNIKGQPIYMRLIRVKAFTTAEVSQWSLKHLHHQSIVVSDGYYCFRGVTRSGFIHESIVAGGRHKSMEIIWQILLHQGIMRLFSKFTGGEFAECSRKCRFRGNSSCGYKTTYAPQISCCLQCSDEINSCGKTIQRLCHKCSNHCLSIIGLTTLPSWISSSSSSTV